MYIKGLFFALIFLCISSFAFGDEKIVTVATLDNYPPYCFRKGNNGGKGEFVPLGSDSAELQGYSWDILRESFHEMGYTIQLNVYSWMRALYNTKKGKDDILFPMGRNRKREKIFHYSQEPVNQARFLIYVRADSPLKWTGLESLNGLRIGSMRGWNYGGKVDSNNMIEKYEISEIIRGFEMLAKKALDGFAGYEVTFDYILKQTGRTKAYKKLPPFDSTAEYLVGLKTNQRIPKILNDFDIGKQAIIQNGKFDEIANKWK